MKLKKFALAALGATFLIGAAAPASFAAPGGRPDHGPGRPGPERGMMQDMMFIRLLKDADANKDGKISKDELVAWEEATFSAIDANKDGNLTPGEIRNYREARMEEWREKRKAERAENKDGPKGPDMAENDAPPPPPGAGPDGKPGPHEGRGPGRHHGERHGMRDGMGPRGMMPGAGLIRMIDTDENGQISKAEATAAVDKMFERMDRNKDGMITVDDLPDRPF
jgi:Ca2+-binding EF-hand superfamily protein